MVKKCYPAFSSAKGVPQKLSPPRMRLARGAKGGVAVVVVVFMITPPASTVVIDCKNISASIQCRDGVTRHAGFPPEAYAALYKHGTPSCCLRM